MSSKRTGHSSSGHHSGSGHSSRRDIKNKNIISIILALIISLSVATCIVCVTVVTGLCNSSILKKSVNESTYYDDKLAEVTDRLTKRLESSGLPGDIAGDVINERLLSVDTNLIISAGLNGNADYMADTSEFNKVMTDKLNAYYEEKGIEKNDILDKATAELVETAAREYASQLSFPFMRYYSEFAGRYFIICRNITFICGGVILISLILLMFVHRRKYRGIRYVNYGLLSGSFLAIIINTHLYRLLKGVVKSDDSVYYNMINTCIDRAYSQGLYICLGGLLAFVLLCCITIYMRKEAI